MKRIILLFAFAITAELSLGQSITLDPSNSSPSIESKANAPFNDLKRTNPSGNSGLRFYNGASFDGGIFHDGDVNQLNITHSFTTPGILYDLNTFNVGIGTSAPIGKLDVANSSTSSANPSMRLLHSSSSGFNRLLMSNLGRSSDWMISSNVGSGAADSRWNVWHTGTGNILTTTGDGFVGIGNSNPAVPFHINYSTSSINSTSGGMILGTLNSSHLTFDGNQIDSWFNTIGLDFYINYYSNGKVRIGNGPTGAGLDVNGFTNLGDGAPSIKMKKLTGTTAATEGGSVGIPHGIGGSDKILSVDIAVEFGFNVYVPENYTHTNNIEFNYYYNDSNIYVINKSANSSYLLSSPIKILITYEE